MTHETDIPSYKPTDVLRLAAAALVKRGVEIDAQDPEKLTIRGRTGFSAFSWGESVFIQVTATANGSHVSCTSQPLLGTNLFAIPKSRDNERAIIEAIRKEAGAP